MPRKAERERLAAKKAAAAERVVPGGVWPAPPTGWEALQQQVSVLFRAGIPRRFADLDTALAIAMAGAELGVGPVQALAQMYVAEDGQLAQQAGLITGLILKSGLGKIIPTAQPTLERATVVATRYGVGGRPDDVVEITFDWPAGRRHTGDAAVDRGWLLARAVAEAARALYRDVLSGVPFCPEDLTARAETTIIGAAAAPQATQPPSPPPSSSPGRRQTPASVPVAALDKAGAVTPPPAAVPASGDGRPARQEPAAATQQPAPPLPPVPAPRALDTTLWLDDPKSGGMIALKTAGLTRPQLDFVVARTTPAGGYEDWAAAAETMRGWLGAQGLPEAKLRYLTAAEADELIGLLKPMMPVPQGNGAAQPAGTARETFERVLASPTVAPHRAAAIRATCRMYAVESLDELTGEQLMAAATDLEQNAQDPAALGIILERLAMQT